MNSVNLKLSDEIIEMYGTSLTNKSLEDVTMLVLAHEKSEKISITVRRLAYVYSFAVAICYTHPLLLNNAIYMQIYDSSVV